METKPIVTSHGNQVLFSSLHKPMLESLPKESAEWRRSYGRPARNVFLEASFVPYDDDILPDETDKTLISRPYFHIFWTDCDLETFKGKVREEIGDWCAALKAKNIPDWLIVVVNNEDNKLKTKLLPRSSVYDKIKSDFCSKHPDRVVVLNDPLRQESKSSVESWNGFIGKLRSMLLAAFTRHLQRYEDNMRALREKRNEVGWNFQQYFIVQEELAFMFEMLGLFDDAMIQYDELDALFSQFILNHASGRLEQIEATYIAVATVQEELHVLLAKQLATEKCLRLESVPWLRSLVCPCKTWAGLSLRKAISWDKRNLIKDNEASLLEFRNYLFSRQCALLMLMNRPGEIVQRAVDYLHQTVQETRTLGIEIGVGCLDCWVFLSGLEVLQRCEKLSDSSQPRTQALNTAYMWDYVCRKLRHLGELCGLMPEFNKSPSSEQLSLVIDLTAGMGLEAEEEEEENDQGCKVLSPRDRLREALSSKGSFQRIYLEQSELAMGTFKHIGRFRSARMIGKNLADFYMKLGEPKKAENFLMDAMSSYHREGWKILRDQSRLELAACQLQVADKHKYIKTACQVTSSSLLDNSDRTFHLDQIHNIAEHSKEPILVRASPLLQVEVTNISASEVTLDQNFNITITLVNNSLRDLKCDTVWLALTECSLESVFDNPRVGQLKQLVSRQTSNSSLDNRKVMNLKLERKQLPSAIELKLHYEGRPGSPVSTGITCVNSHELLARKDSVGSTLTSSDDNIVKDLYSQSVSLNNLILKPGENEVTLKCEGITAGHYRPGQAGVNMGHVEFVHDLTSNLTVTVVCDETYCEIIPGEINRPCCLPKLHLENLLAGVKTDITVCLHSGSTPVDANSKVKVVPSDGLVVEMSDLDNTVVTEKLGRGEVHEWSMKLFQEPKVTGGQTIQNKLAFDCSWLPRPLMTCVTFQNPFVISHKLHTAKEMKYVQVVVQGQSVPEFQMMDWSLECPSSRDVELIRLNKPSQTQKVNVFQHPSCLWQIKSNILELPPLDLLFTMHYSCLTDPKETNRQLSYKFCIRDYQTQYTVKADVTSLAESKVCKTGSLATFKLTVMQLPGCRQPADQEFMYEVDGEQNWTVHGKSTGVFSMAGGTNSTSLEVIPLVAGFLPLPKLTLYKYKATTPAQEIWNKKADLEKCENLDSTDDDSSENDGEESQSQPNHTAFEDGQVYYGSRGKQVHVYPESSSGEIEISLI